MEKNDFLEIVKIVYLTPENAKFYETDNGFPCVNAFIPMVKKDDLDTSSSEEPVWQDLSRVFFHRAFPYDSADTFISVTDKDGNEYGVIKSLGDFDGKGRDIIEKELKRKYFTPVIQKIFSLKERFGYSYWETETNHGRMSFAMHDTFRNIAKVSESRLVLTDVDGNRFEIPDVMALDRKSFRKIELYL
ncbi:MAG: DUF1854 domain-containing protein [Eubacteriales bacterium]|nr:DUF1854 domain-containing protein [Eubacteriales bacterium]